MLPAAAVWPALGWQAPAVQKLVVLVLALTVYAGWALGLRLLPAGELRDLATALRARPASSEARAPTGSGRG